MDSLLPKKRKSSSSWIPAALFLIGGALYFGFLSPGRPGPVPDRSPAIPAGSHPSGALASGARHPGPQSAPVPSAAQSLNPRSAAETESRVMVIPGGLTRTDIGIGQIPKEGGTSGPVTYPSMSPSVSAFGAAEDLPLEENVPVIDAEAMKAEMEARLKEPAELPEDLRRQLAAPPPPLPDDLKAQLNAPPPEIPDDIKRALKIPPRIVTLEEVNNPAGLSSPEPTP